MLAGKHNITLEQGADFSDVIEHTDDDDVAIPLPGWTGAAQVRSSFNSPTALLTFTVEIDEALGLVALSATAEQTGIAGRGYYDVELTDPDGGVIRLAEGEALFHPGVTRV